MNSELKPSDLKEKTEYIRSIVPKVKVPEFVPKEMKVITDESVTQKEEEEYTDEDDVICREIVDQLPPPEVI